ncbi:MAG: acetyl-CoA carboxylase biotin carboxylase subunit, partial [Oscillospiraceae bacterium]
ADKDALHVSLADESVCIGSPKAQDSYLNKAAILSAAMVTGAQAIHPGYGLLSENAEFAELCKQCNITFIGPSSKVIEKMGDKDMARKTMKAAGVPIIEGSEVVDTLNNAIDLAIRIGFPLLIKARSGGGGKGIRLVTNLSEFESAFHAAKQEAEKSFNDSGVYLEKYLYPVKHIEMQLLCDSFGNCVCLGERECSIQRKNQKLIEESPSYLMDEKTREKMIEVTQKAALAAGYENAGTIEFLYCNDGSFYFMEMNTRLQVEHTVTEMVSGIDIVKWQLRIAAGQKLSFSQEDVVIKGSAIECRICAEDPENNFTPSCGKIDFLHVPGGPNVRFDTALYQGYHIPPFYDSMIGKLVVYAATREETIRKMQAALCELIVDGVKTNKELQMEILSDPRFKKGDYGTDFMENK